MALFPHRRHRVGLHPLHALLLGFPISLFTTAVCADVAYLNTAEMQWSNLAAWAITGALIVGVPVLVWAALGTIRGRTSLSILYPVLLAMMWGLGLVNAFQHSRDGWSSVGTAGLTLSVLSTLAAMAAGWIAFSARQPAGALR